MDTLKLYKLYALRMWNMYVVLFYLTLIFQRSHHSCLIYNKQCYIDKYNESIKYMQCGILHLYQRDIYYYLFF